MKEKASRLGALSAAGSLPSVPTIGVAVPGNGSATVAFTPSVFTGKSATVTYRATASPGGAQGTCSAPCASIVVNGLTNGTQYTFTVRAETTYGINSPNSIPSNMVTPVAPPPAPVSPAPAPVSPAPAPVSPPCVPQPSSWSNCNAPNTNIIVEDNDEPCGVAGTNCAGQCCNGLTNATGTRFKYYYDSCGNLIGACLQGWNCEACPADCTGFVGCDNYYNGWAWNGSYTYADPAPHGVCSGCTFAEFKQIAKAGCETKYCWTGGCTGCPPAPVSPAPAPVSPAPAPVSPVVPCQVLICGDGTPYDTCNCVCFGTAVACF